MRYYLSSLQNKGWVHSSKNKRNSMRKISFLSLIVLLVSLMVGHSASLAQSKSLEFEWKLDGFDRPESLYPSAAQSEIYVSNVNGDSRA